MLEFNYNQSLSTNPAPAAEVFDRSLSSTNVSVDNWYSCSQVSVLNVSLISRISISNDLKPKGIVVTAFHPGWVQTDMGGPGAEITAEESASGIRNVISGLTKEDSGNFYKWNGEIHPWQTMKLIKG